MQKLLLTGLIGLLLCTACQKSVDETIVTETLEPRTPIAQLTFLVRNTQQQPLANAAIILDDKTYRTDANGRVTVANVMVPTRGLAVKSQEAGYFTGFQRILTDSRELTITMAPKNAPHQFQAREGWAADIPNEPVRLAVPANAFETEQGQLYNGLVNLSYLRTTRETPEFEALMVPAFAVSEKEDQRRVVAPFGAFLIEATTPDGTRLRLRKGQALTVDLLSATVCTGFRAQSLLRLDAKGGNVWQAAGEVTTLDSTAYRVLVNELYVPWTLLAINNTNFLNFEIGDKSYLITQKIKLNNFYNYLFSGGDICSPNGLFINFVINQNQPFGQAVPIEAHFWWVRINAQEQEVITCLTPSIAQSICPDKITLTLSPTNFPQEMAGTISGKLPDGRTIRGNFYYKQP